MILLTHESLSYVLATQFLAEAMRGHLWVPRDVSGVFADAISATVRNLPAIDLTVHVDTDNGTASVWYLAETLIAHEGVTTAVIGNFAKSAGLIISVACQRRTCQPNTEFLYHGSPYKFGVEDDHAKAKWFASRTTMPEEFWYDMAIDGKDRVFGETEAWEWGILRDDAPEV